MDELLARFPASNLTLLGRAGGRLVVYKPSSGVVPLWDFAAPTLARREVLTYRVAEAMGLGVVPETWEAGGPLGPGALQRYVAPDPERSSLDLVARRDGALWPVAVLDLVTNNADRKLGHVLVAEGEGRLWAIDHGLTFHPAPKLRTVLWGFAGLPLPAPMVGALLRLEAALRRGLEADVAAALGRPEAQALRRRCRALLRNPVHPPAPRHRHPLPWPPY